MPQKVNLGTKYFCRDRWVTPTGAISDRNGASLARLEAGRIFPRVLSAQQKMSVKHAYVVLPSRSHITDSVCGPVTSIIETLPMAGFAEYCTPTWTGSHRSSRSATVDAAR